MKFLCSFLFFAIALPFLPATSGAAEVSPVEVPWQKIEVLMKAADFAPVVIAPGARLEKDYMEKWVAWSERVLVLPFQQRLTDRSADEQEKAGRFVREALWQHLKLPGRDPEMTAATLVEQAQALEKAGLDDPAIGWLHGWAFYESTRDYERGNAILTKALKHAKLKGAPPFLRFRMLLTLAEVRKDAKRKDGVGDRVIVEAAQATLVDADTYRPEDDEILLENVWVLFGERFATQEARIADLVKLPGRTEWARLMLEAEFEQAKAWKYRGTRWSNEVTDEGWRGFEAHLSVSTDKFRKAWELFPDRPRAAAMMVNAVKCGQGKPGETVRLWFDRAVQGRADYELAYRCLLGALLPRWGGSHEAMMAFALACVETRRYDTQVPWFFLNLLKRVLDEDGEWQRICQNPVISPVLVHLCEKRIEQARTEREKQEAHAEMGLYAWAAGDYARSAQAFEGASAVFPTEVRRATHYFKTYEREVRGEAVIRSRGAGDAWDDAVGLYEEGHLAACVQACDTLLAQVKGGDGADLVSSVRAAATFEQELAQGGWVDLIVAPRLVNWRIQKGDWQGTPEGVLTLRGVGESAFILYNGRVGTEFEIQGQFEVKGPPDAGMGLGTVAGYGLEGTKEHWITCLHSGVGNESSGNLLDGFFASTAKRVPVKASAREGSFHIVCQGGAITYTINDQTVFESARPAESLYPDRPLKLMQDGQIGFCHYLFSGGTETRLLYAKVKVLSKR